MIDLPDSQTYEKEYQYMPWGKLMDRVSDIVLNEAPSNGRVLDLMCGTGHLIEKVYSKRKDLSLVGVDADKDFIDYATKKHSGKSIPNPRFILADALDWQPSEVGFDLITCTAGVHHIPYDIQEKFLFMINHNLRSGGFAIIADPFIVEFKDEGRRKIAAAKLGYEYLLAVMNNQAPPEIVNATINIMRNDVLGHEYKTSLNRTKSALERLFGSVEVEKIWPEKKSSYGDFILIARRPRYVTGFRG